MKPGYLPHISGMKGMGALIVFIHHFFYCFYPLFLPEGSTTAPIEHIPAANLLVNGNFAVCLFILLSGYLVARNAARYDSMDQYGEAVVKRYLRLLIPLAVAAALSYLLCVLRIYRIHEVSDALGNELTANYFSVIRFHHLILSVFLAPFGYHVLVGPFWMMNYILVGAFLVMGITLVIRRLRPELQLLTILFVAGLLLYREPYYACVMAGMFLYKVGERPMKIPAAARITAILLFLAAACWLAADQAGVLEYDIYKNLLAAFLFVSAVLLSTSLRKVFCCRLMDRLGELSLGIYIFHWPVICSLSCRLYLGMPLQGKWLLLGFIFIVSLALTILLAHLYNRWMAPAATSLQKWALNRLYR